MDETMSTRTKTEIMVKMRRRYLTAGWEHKGKLIDEAVSLFGYHRKAAIRMLNGTVPRRLSIVTGRPREYEAGISSGWRTQWLRDGVGERASDVESRPAKHLGGFNGPGADAALCLAGIG